MLDMRAEPRTVLIIFVTKPSSGSGSPNGSLKKLERTLMSRQKRLDILVSMRADSGGGVGVST